MRALGFTLAFCAAIILTQQASIAADADSANCEAILNGGVPGLYIAYPGSPQLRRIKSGASTRYDRSARFYFVPGVYVASHREGVWHVRTQTEAATPSADEVLVWRPPAATLCSDGKLPAFDQNQRFVSLERYFDYHPSEGRQRGADVGLRKFFHFNIYDEGRSKPCSARTDDPRFVGDLRKFYGFDRVERGRVAIADATSVSRAQAAQAPFAGLSSELTYTTGPAKACFGFAVPMPTHVTGWTFPWRRNAIAFQQALTWHPKYTFITIRQVPKGHITELTVRWTD